MNPLDNPNDPPTTRHGVLYTGFHAGGGGRRPGIFPPCNPHPPEKVPTFGAMARAPVLFFGLELPDTIAYKRTEAFVDFDFTFLFILVGT